MISVGQQLPSSLLGVDHGALIAAARHDARVAFALAEELNRAWTTPSATREAAVPSRSLGDVGLVGARSAHGLVDGRPSVESHRRTSTMEIPIPLRKDDWFLPTLNVVKAPPTLRVLGGRDELTPRAPP